MTEEDKYALKEFLLGAGAVVGVLITFIVIPLVIINLSLGDKTIDESSFKVVDKYRECDIVRYAPHQAAEYKYLLYCGGNK